MSAGTQCEHNLLKSACPICGVFEMTGITQPTTKHDELSKEIDEYVEFLVKNGITEINFGNSSFVDLVHLLKRVQSALITNEQAIRRDESPELIEDIIGEVEQLPTGKRNGKTIILKSGVIELLKSKL